MSAQDGNKLHGRFVGRPGDAGARLDAVRHFWDNHVHDWKVAKSEAGTKEFFEEIEEYRFEKLNYLPEVVDFGGYAGQRILDLGCGVGNDLSRFAKGGANVVGVDLAPHSIELAENNFRQRGLDGEFQIVEQEVLVMDPLERRAHATAGNTPAFGSIAGTPRPSSASSQRLAAMIFASDTPVSIPERDRR